MYAISISSIRALTSLNLASNLIGAEGAKHVAEAIKVNVSALLFDWHHFELELTCGSTAVVDGYCYYITTKGAMAKFDISKNNLSMEGGKSLAEALAGNSIMTELNLTSNRLTEKADESGYDMSGVIAIGNTIPTMGALTSLNISANSLGEYWDDGKGEWISDMTGVKALAAAIPGCK